MGSFPRGERRREGTDPSPVRFGLQGVYNGQQSFCCWLSTEETLGTVQVTNSRTLETPSPPRHLLSGPRTPNPSFPPLRLSGSPHPTVTLLKPLPCHPIPCSPTSPSLHPTPRLSNHVRSPRPSSLRPLRPPRSPPTDPSSGRPHPDWIGRKGWDGVLG